MGALEKLLQFRLRVGRVWGIEVSIHWTLLALDLYVLYRFRHELALGVLIMLVGMICVFLHELGHCWGARRVGGRADEILMWPLGGLAMVDAPMTPWAQFVTTGCGPGVNVILATVFTPIYLLAGGSFASLVSWGTLPAGLGLAGCVLWYTVFLNTVMVVFNLVPAFPMDGGRLLQVALWPKLGFHRAMQIAIYAAYASAAGMILIGFAVRDSFLVLIGFFVVSGSVQQQRLLRAGAFDMLLARQPWEMGEFGLGYGVAPEPARRPSRFARWRERRRRRRDVAERRRKVEMRERMDEILAKVSREGLNALSREERRFLDQASAELRKESGRR